MQVLVCAQLRPRRQILNRGDTAFARFPEHCAHLRETLFERDRRHGLAHDLYRRPAQHAGHASIRIADEFTTRWIRRRVRDAGPLQRERVGENAD
jgi:hypothetical protein